MNCLPLHCFLNSATLYPEYLSHEGGRSGFGHRRRCKMFLQKNNVQTIPKGIEPHYTSRSIFAGWRIFASTTSQEHVKRILAAMQVNGHVVRSFIN